MELSVTQAGGNQALELPSRIKLLRTPSSTSLPSLHSELQSAINTVVNYNI